MRILLLNQAYYPDVAATAQHLTDWAEHLARQRHDVTVIASRSLYGKQGAVLPRFEIRNGVRILRTGQGFFNKGRILSRLADFILFHLMALIRALRLPQQDVVVCLTTPPFIGLVGLLLKTLRKSRYVQYEMDLYPDVPVALGILNPKSLLAKSLEALHRTMLRRADRVIVLGRCMRNLIAAKNIDPQKLLLVTPWADPREIRPLPRASNPFRRQHHLEDNFVIMYSGNLGLGHDISAVIAAITDLAASRSSADRFVRFVFIGGGRRMAEIRRFVASHHLHNVLILDYQPREKLAQTLSAADLHLVTQAQNTQGLLVPSKFYGILAAGRPTLYIGPKDAEVPLAIRQHRLGDVFTIDDTPGVLAAIRAQVAAGPSESFESHARQILRTHFSRQICCDKLTRMIEQLAERDAAPLTLPAAATRFSHPVIDCAMRFTVAHTHNPFAGSTTSLAQPQPH